MTQAVKRVHGMSVFDPGCITREILEHATGRWGGLTLVALTDGPLRFAELARTVGGISDKMLSQTLHRLEDDGLIHRTAHDHTASRVDYTLTDLGAPLAQSLSELIDTIYTLVPTLVARRRAHNEQRTPAGTHT